MSSLLNVGDILCSFYVHFSSAPVSLRAPILPNTQSLWTGQFTHAWVSPWNNNRTTVPNQFSLAKLATRHKLCKYMARWHSVMSQSHWMKCATSCFRSSLFCGREELLLVQTLTFLTFKITKKKLYKTLKKESKWKKKHNRYLFTLRKSSVISLHRLMYWTLNVSVSKLGLCFKIMFQWEEMKRNRCILESSHSTNWYREHDLHSQRLNWPLWCNLSLSSQLQQRLTPFSLCFGSPSLAHEY